MSTRPKESCFERRAPAISCAHAQLDQSTPVDSQSLATVTLLRRKRARELDCHFGLKAVGLKSRFRSSVASFASMVLGVIAIAVAGPLTATTQGAERPARKDTPSPISKSERAIFAGGCFWCVQPAFELLPGVTKVTAGYSGGNGGDPNYTDYAAKGHVEVVEIIFDPDLITYAQLLDVLWRQIDPTDLGGQFVDRGTQYRSAIFYLNAFQQQQATLSKEALGHSGRFNRPVLTEIVSASTFYPAEEYHQDYHRKNPIRYAYYRSRSGRDAYLDRIWGKDRLNRPTILAAAPTPVARSQVRPPAYSQEELRTRLTPIQFAVTQQAETEPPFDNEYWDNEKPGIYTDVVSGEPLYSSMDKFNSGTGWPSFSKPLEPRNIVEKQDRGFFTTRTEVRSRAGNSHLGHVFRDGPQPTGLRYCMNSAALRFVPKDKLKEEGFGQYLSLFETKTH